MRNSFIPDLDFEVRIAKGLRSLQERLSVIIAQPEGIIEKPGNFRIPTTSCDHPIIDRATEYRRGERGERGHPTPIRDSIDSSSISWSHNNLGRRLLED
jgi:hypothetical protein